VDKSQLSKIPLFSVYVNRLHIYKYFVITLYNVSMILSSTIKHSSIEQSVYYYFIIFFFTYVQIVFYNHP